MKIVYALIMSSFLMGSQPDSFFEYIDSVDRQFFSFEKQERINKNSKLNLNFYMNYPRMDVNREAQIREWIESTIIFIQMTN